MREGVMVKIDVDERDGAVIISIAGELSMSDIKEFDYTFKNYLHADIHVIALDLKYMHYLDSFGISRIIKISREFVGSGIEFVLLNMNDNIHQIFRMATFDKIFKILTTEEFLLTYFPSGSTAYRSGRNNASTVDEPDGNQKESKIIQVEIKDNTGTTLVFLEDE
jgi:anti-anti-sigma factor